MEEEQRNAEVVRQLAERWNAGDIEGMLEFYADDLEMMSDPDWPDPAVTGKDAFRRYSREWQGAWERAQIDYERIQAAGERVLVEGFWDVRGAATGISGQMAFSILFTLSDGLVTRHQWFRDPSGARRTAGLG